MIMLSKVRCYLCFSQNNKNTRAEAVQGTQSLWPAAAAGEQAKLNLVLQGMEEIPERIRKDLFCDAGPWIIRQVHYGGRKKLSQYKAIRTDSV